MSKLTPEVTARLDELISRYPVKKAALLPALWVMQEVYGGVLTPEAMRDTAEYLELPPAEVAGVATFYTMYVKEPIGKHHIEICHNVPCMAFGAEELIAYCERRLGIHSGETTADGLFTLNRAECLGACCNAPVVQVGGTYFEDVTRSQMDAILEQLKAAPSEVEKPPQGMISETLSF
jgi:NADH-quinone oxidoreductase E subunit